MQLFNQAGVAVTLTSYSVEKHVNNCGKLLDKTKKKWYIMHNRAARTALRAWGPGLSATLSPFTL